jgi:DNA-binding transcriptional LysR family regulator
VDPSAPELEPLPSRELAAFVAAVDAGGIGAAADSLALTQSAVTKRIQSLERRLGTALLERSHSGVRPTAAGSALYPDAREGLLALARAAQALRRERSACVGRLSLAASHTIGTFLLPRWLAAFKMAVPAARPSVSVVNSHGVLAAIHARDAEIGFVPDPSPHEGLDVLRVGRDELVVVVGASHRWARAGRVTPSQLASEPFLTREEGSGTRAAGIQAVRSLGIELQPQLETSSIEVLKRTVVGGGFTIMSALAIGDERSANGLRTLRVRGASMRRELFAIRRGASPLAHTALQFWSWLEANRS